MDTHLWVKEKGRLLGPYTIEKLKQLVDENWLSKMHLISTDQMTWINAGDYESGMLWIRDEQIQTTENEDLNLDSAGAAETNPEHEKHPHVAEVETDWWYTRNGQQLGPISLEQLQNMLGCQDLKADEQVWKDGMKYWKAAKDVPALQAHIGTEEPNPEPPLTPDFFTVANTSRGWTIFISIAFFISAAGSIIAGFIDLVHAIKAESNLWLVISIATLITGGVTVAAGLMILSISNRMAAAAHLRTPSALTDALGALNRYWLFLAIVIIVSFAVGGIAFLVQVVNQV